MRNLWNPTEHGVSLLTTISDAGSTPAASTSLRPLRGLRLGKPVSLNRKEDVSLFPGEGCRAGASAQADLFPIVWFNLLPG